MPSLEPGRVDAPAFFFVDHATAGEESHAVLYVGPRRGGAEIWDPLVGKRFYAPAKLRQVWHGRAISCHLESSDPRGGGVTPVNR